jgi:hypothetical protein
MFARRVTERLAMAEPMLLVCLVAESAAVLFILVRQLPLPLSSIQMTTTRSSSSSCSSLVFFFHENVLHLSQFLGENFDGRPIGNL